MTTLVHIPVALPIGLGEQCDREPCGAQARVRVRVRAVGKVLDFCKHHFERAESALMSAATVVSDQRAELDVKIGIGIAPGVPPSLPSNQKGGSRS